MQVMTAPGATARESSLLESATHAERTGDSLWDGLDGVDIARMVAATRTGERTRPEGLDRLAAIKRLKSWVAAAEFAQLTEIAGVQERVSLATVDGRSVAMHDADIAEIAIATRTSEAEVRRDLAAARVIEESLPAVKAGLAAGTVNEQQARAIARAAERVPEVKRADVAAALLLVANRANAQVLRSKAEGVIAEVDPDGGEDRRVRAQRRRAVWVHDEEDGVSLLCARLLTVDAHACLRVIIDRASANLTEDLAELEATAEPVPHGVRLADTFVDTLLASSRAERIVLSADGEILEQGASTAHGGHVAAARATVFVSIDLPTLLGLQDSPITIDGNATAPASQLRDLLHRVGDVDLRRLITDPITGGLIELGQRSYRPQRSLVRHVQVRDGCCQWVGGCTVPADSCDLDHMVPFERGGSTSADNLIVLCRWHHLLKTFHGYTPIRTSDGAIQWLLPHDV